MGWWWRQRQSKKRWMTTPFSHGWSPGKTSQETASLQSVLQTYVRYSSYKQWTTFNKNPPMTIQTTVANLKNRALNIATMSTLYVSAAKCCKATNENKPAYTLNKALIYEVSSSGFSFTWCARYSEILPGQEISLPLLSTIEITEERGYTFVPWAWYASNHKRNYDPCVPNYLYQQ
jgi:hypothetical protein